MGENGVGRENCDKIEKFRHIDKNELILRKDKIKGGYSKKISYNDFSDSAMTLASVPAVNHRHFHSVMLARKSMYDFCAEFSFSF